MKLPPVTRRTRCEVFLGSLAAALLIVVPPALTGCGRAGGLLDEKAALPEKITPGEAETARSNGSDEPVSEARSTSQPADARGDDGPTSALEALRKRGRFEEFIDATLNSADEHRDNPAVQLLKVEALLAMGSSARAEDAAERAATLALDAGDAPLAVQALKLWVMARFRRGAALASPSVAALVERLPTDESGAAMIRYWFDTLAERAPYQIEIDDDTSSGEVPPTRAAEGTVWADLNAIEVRAGDAALPMVFIDTGAQHTLITRRGAKLAGILADESDTRLVGFAGVTAQPAVLDTLELGGLTLRNVPVLVGDSAALVSNNGQMALGTELMHHVRFTLDYPARRVTVEPAARAPLAAAASTRMIPLWTFSQACLARADLPRGAAARVLVDTGNRQGTYLSARWAQRNLPRFQHPTSSLVFKFKNRHLNLDTMDLGSLVLGDWPIVDRIPAELERLDLVDILVGHDLLGSYRLTIDLRQRVLRLEGDSGGPQPPSNAMP